MTADDLAMLLIISLVINITLILICSALLGENHRYRDSESRFERETKETWKDEG